MKLTKRAMEIINQTDPLIAAGYNYKEISEKIGISADRISATYITRGRLVKMSGEWDFGLSSRTANILKSNGIYSVDALHKAMTCGVTFPFLGPKTIKELEEFAGIKYEGRSI